MGSDTRRLLLMALLAVWAVFWGMSFYAFVSLEPQGEGFVRGMNRTTTFLGWQMAAALPAFGAWAVARAWPKESGVRSVARVPLQLALGLAAVIGGLILWAAVFGGG